MKKILSLYLILSTLFLLNSHAQIYIQSNETQPDQEPYATHRLYLPALIKTASHPRERTILRNYYIENPGSLYNLGCTIGQYAAGDSRAQSYYSNCE